MNALRTIWLRIRSLVTRCEAKREIDEELRFHLEQAVEENIASGMMPEEAARAARKRFGNLQSVREECRSAKGASFGETLAQDVRFGFRTLRKNPGFTIVAVLTLALGIGANTSMFSLVNLILFRPLPYPEADRLMRIYRISSRSPRDGHSIGTFLDLREQNTVFERVAAFYPDWPCNLARPGEPAELVSGMLVTADFFAALGIQPEIGRGFTAEEDMAGHEGVVVLGHGFWERRFSGDRNIIGRTLRLDGQNATVVGVMPERADNPLLWEKLDLLRPFAFGANQRQNRGDNWRFAFGRLKPGASIAQANAEMKALAQRFANDHPKTEAGYGLRVIPLRDSASEQDGPILSLSLGLACSVLLIACVNLANLLLARLAGRSRELAVRVALGASRARLLRQLLTECLLVSLIGGALGLLIAMWAKDFLGNRLSIEGDTGLPIPLDARVVAFALLCCVGATVLFGTAPAWLASRKDVNEQLKEGSRGNTAGGWRHRWRHGLIIGEVALALVLLTAAGLFILGLQRYARREVGWRVDGMLTGELDLTSAKYKSPEQRLVFLRELEERLSAIPVVTRLAMSSRPPVLPSRFHRDIAFEGRPPAPAGQHFFAGVEPVTPGYFDTIGIRLKEGRLFTSADTANRPDVIIVNETMARQCWPNQSPLGKRVGDADSASPGWQEIVGVVSDVWFPVEFNGDKPQPQTYRPLAQEPPEFVTIELRFSGGTESVAAALHQAVAAADPDQSVARIWTARQWVQVGMHNISMLGGLLTTFAILGLLLAAIGIYGVISYTVAQRSGEIGLRMALGARRRNVLWLVLRQGLSQTLLGALLGLAGAWGVARLLSAVIPFMPADGMTFGGVTLLMFMVAMLACLIPAWRAAKVDPMEALRCE